jgi:hypothetical protein
VRRPRLDSFSTRAIPFEHEGRPSRIEQGEQVSDRWIRRNVLTICGGKSTYARCGMITNLTPFAYADRQGKYQGQQG